MSDKSKTIEEKMAQLRQLTEWFEGEDFTLGEAADKFEQANKLAREIEHDLTTMKNKVAVLKESFESE